MDAILPYVVNTAHWRRAASLYGHEAVDLILNKYMKFSKSENTADNILMVIGELWRGYLMKFVNDVNYTHLKRIPAFILKILFALHHFLLAYGLDSVTSIQQYAIDSIKLFVNDTTYRKTKSITQLFRYFNRAILLKNETDDDIKLFKKAKFSLVKEILARNMVNVIEQIPNLTEIVNDNNQTQDIIENIILKFFLASFKQLKMILAFCRVIEFFQQIKLEKYDKQLGLCTEEDVDDLDKFVDGMFHFNNFFEFFEKLKIIDDYPNDNEKLFEFIRDVLHHSHKNTYHGFCSCGAQCEFPWLQHCKDHRCQCEILESYVSQSDILDSIKNNTVASLGSYPCNNGNHRNSMFCQDHARLCQAVTGVTVVGCSVCPPVESGLFVPSFGMGRE